MTEGHRKELGWDFLSLLIHAALLAALVLCTPVREIVLKPRRQLASPTPPAPEKIERIGEKISEARASELHRDIEALQTVLNDMEVVRDQLHVDFDEVARELAVDIKEDLVEQLNAAKDFQRKAIENQKSIQKDVEKLAALEQEDLDKSHKELNDVAAKLFWEDLMEVADIQARAQNALDRIRTAAEFAGYERVAEAAAELRDAQIDAARTQAEESNAVLEPTSKIKDYGYLLERLGGERKRAEEEKARAAESRLAAEVAEREKADAERRMSAAGGNQEERRKAEKERNSAERKASDARRRAESAERRAAEMESRAAATQSILDEKKKHVKAIDVESQKARIPRAADAQLKVLLAMDNLSNAIANDSPNPRSHSPDAIASNPLSTMDATHLSISESYEAARTLEEAITETYREVVAASTALEQRLPLEEAGRLTDVAKPVRETFDHALLDGKARTAEGLAAQKEAQYDAVREAGNMVEASYSLMHAAFRMAGARGYGEERPGWGARHPLPWLRHGDLSDHGKGERIGRFIGLSGLASQLENAAAENKGMRFRDVSGLTRIGGRAQSGISLPDRDFIRKVGQDALEASPNSQEGAAHAPHEAGTGADLVPGNVISFDEASGGLPASWVYLNSWWVIGPFPNPGRINLTRKFPPESTVDLDASYAGEGGQVRWRFVQGLGGTANKGLLRRRAQVSPPGKPEYTIWYGWTKIRVDRDCDVWLAAGSDDRSDVWVNGLKVWASGNNLKVWTIDEGFRKVHLRKGDNEILVRLENGHGPCGFSICISPHDPPPPL